MPREAVRSRLERPLLRPSASSHEYMAGFFASEGWIHYEKFLKRRYRAIQRQALRALLKDEKVSRAQAGVAEGIRYAIEVAREDILAELAITELNSTETEPSEDDGRY